MAFKSSGAAPTVPETPDQILLDLPRRKIPSVLLHQGEVLRQYAKERVADPDVALQLPTGSGKTLVGLLLAEWRRRKFQERVLYLCPTKQLVHQVVEQANDHYGLDIIGFTGSKHEYSPAAKSAYQNADKIAVTTYSSLFNVSPYFTNADLILLDDAHVADNYISDLWTIQIDRADTKHQPIHRALANLLRPLIGNVNYARLVGQWNGPSDAIWVDKLSTPQLAKCAEEMIAVFDAHVGSLDLSYSWSVVRDHLLACQVYLTSNHIFIRPLIVPTWTHGSFTRAKQRIYISATLGDGGDLERIVGRKAISRITIPQGWDRQGIGRRFFMFPDMSLYEAEAQKLSLSLMEQAGRSVVLVPTDPMRKKIAATVNEKLGFPAFDAPALEQSKKPFTSEEQAVAVIANRYDGIDFPGSTCRLLFIEGLPSVMNPQERFIMSRLGGNILYNDRIQTRVIQAIGRCTRSMEDYSGVVVSGGGMEDYLLNRDRRRYFHPELQAEIEFGIEQSTNTTADDFLENFRIFLENKSAWESANRQILAKRDQATRAPFPAREELSKSVGFEIGYQAAIWNADWEQALGSAESVLGCLMSPELKGYRALWHYLAGSAAFLAAKNGSRGLDKKARDHFRKAKDAAPGVYWLISLTKDQGDDQTEETDVHPAIARQIEQIEHMLEGLGASHDRKYTLQEAEILTGLASPESFEQAQKNLGFMLGYSAGKVESDGSPDPWWLCDNYCFVFEDYVNGANGGELSATKARQIAAHAAWITKNVPAASGAEITAVLVARTSSASDGAAPLLDGFAYWDADNFVSWAANALGVIRELRSIFPEAGDLDWKARAYAALVTAEIDVVATAKRLKSSPASKSLTVKNRAS